MDVIADFIIDASHFFRGHLGKIALAIVATLLVLYGDRLNRFVKRAVSPYHFLIRTISFILLCTFGYGAIIIFATPLIGEWLGYLNNYYLAPVLLFIFISLGMMAEKKNHI